MSKRNRLPKGWSWTRFDSLLSLEYGRAFPKTRRQHGPYAVYGSNGIVDRANKYLLESETIIVGRKGSAGEICIAEPKSWPIDTTYFVELKGKNIESVEFLYYLLLWFDPRRLVDPSVKPGLNRDRVYEKEIPLPPLAVQERIVEVLQQADVIRRKRAEASWLADQIIPALFHSSFLSQKEKWKFLSLRECVLFKSGGTPSRKNKEYWQGDIPWVSPSDMKSLEILTTEEHISKVAVEKSATNLVEPSTLLIVVRSGILAHTFPIAIARRQVTFNQDIKALTPRNGMLLPEFLFWALKAQSNQVLRSMVKRGSTVHSIDTEVFPDLQIPVPSLPYQQNFIEQASKMYDALANKESSSVSGEDLFSALLSRAFTGELTTEWEAANEGWITELQTFYQQLPRLALLSLLLEQHRRAGRKGVTLITALMKYVFFTQMEGELRRRLYRFVPYHYGPCAIELYNDLKALQADGLIAVDNNAEEDKTRITLTDPARAAALLEEEARKDDTRLAALEKAGEDTETAADPAMSRLLKRRAETLETLRADAATILDSYGNLDHNSLLKSVYERYPAYAMKSRVRKGRKSTSDK